MEGEREDTEVGPGGGGVGIGGCQCHPCCCPPASSFCCGCYQKVRHIFLSAPRFVKKVLQIFKISNVPFLDRKSRWQFPSREDRNGNPWPLQQIRPRSFEHARRDRKSDSFFYRRPPPIFPSSPISKVF